MGVTLFPLPGLSKVEYGFKADSGRFLKVTVHKVVNYDAPGLKDMGAVPDVDNPSNYHLIYKAWLMHEDGTPVLEPVPQPIYKLDDKGEKAINPADGDPIVEGWDTTSVMQPAGGGVVPRPINASGIAAGQDSLQDHWKLWQNVDAPMIDHQPPPGLAPTEDVVVDKDGFRWWCWRGHPDASPMDAKALRGDFYLDANSTLKYRVRASLLEYHATDCAAMYDGMLTAHAEPENLGLPTI